MKKLFLILSLAFLCGCQSLGYVKNERYANMAQELFDAEKQARDLKADIIAVNEKNAALEDEARIMRSEKESFDGRNEILKQEAETAGQKAARLEKLLTQISRDDKNAEFIKLNEDYAKLAQKSKLYEIEIGELKKTNAKAEAKNWSYQAQIAELKKDNAALLKELKAKEQNIGN